MRITILIGAAVTTAAAAVAQTDPVGIIVIRDGDEQVRQLKATLERHDYANSPLAKAAQRNPGLVQAQVGLLGVSALAGVSPWEGAGLLLGEQTIISLAPGEADKPRVCAVTTLRDPEKADQFLDAILSVAGLQVAGEPRDGATRQISGRPVYVADELHLCRVHDALIVSNDRAAMEDAIAALDDGVADLPMHAGSAPAEATIWAALDPHALRAMGVNVPDRMPNALGGLLFGGWARAIADADALTAWTTTGADGLAFTIDVQREGEWPATHSGFLADDIDRLPINLDRMIAEFSFDRDWAPLFSERESLLTLNASGQLVEFATTLTAIMGQLDFIEEVLPRVDGPVRFFAVNRAPGELDFEPTPTLPGLALVAPLDLQGVDLAQRLYSGAQMLMTIINFERAEQGKPSMLLDIGEHRGVRLVMGSFGAPDGDLVGPEYNFEPALAVVEGRLVAASTRGLLEAIVDQVLDAQASVVGAQDLVRIGGDQLAAILAENREELVAKDMLEKGKTKETATRDINAVIAALQLIETAALDANVTTDGARATITVELDAP